MSMFVYNTYFYVHMLRVSNKLETDLFGSIWSMFWYNTYSYVHMLRVSNKLETDLFVYQHLPEDSDRGYQALYTVNNMINTCDTSNTDTFSK